MALSWNEMRIRAQTFTNEWKDAKSERSEAQSFWNDFFQIFGITRKRVAVFEKLVKKINDTAGYVDLFWPGTLLIEHKSRDRSLDEAFDQALEYFVNLGEEETPNFILVCDFQVFILYSLEERTSRTFRLEDLSKNIDYFSFILGYSRKSFADTEAANIRAAEMLGDLRDKLLIYGYKGSDLEIFLARIMFCLFADDTGIFETKDHLSFYLETKTKDDGSDFGMHLLSVFDILDVPLSNRQTNLDEDLAKFPYVNGELFRDRIRMPSFNSDLRKQFLKCCHFNWENISPAIFGSLFQSVMDPEKRRDLGAHYTSEANILKAIGPLFLDEMNDELAIANNNEDLLKSFLEKIRKIKVLDPACGCGNFLVIAYRELRVLEIKAHVKLRERLGANHTLLVDGVFAGIDVDALYGIEIQEFACKIAQVALWLVDHQMNILLSQSLGQILQRIPLKKSAKIVHKNALRMDWEDVVPKSKVSYIISNPPFVGQSLRDRDQSYDMDLVFANESGYSNVSSNNWAFI